LSDLRYLVALSQIAGVGPVKLRLIRDRFGDMEWAWRAGAADFTAAGLDEKTVQEIVARRPRISPDREMERLEEAGIQVLTWEHNSYPSRLKEIYSAPAVLYLKGNVLPEDEWAVAVVGTRRATVYGREATEQLAGALGRNRITVVSGLAKGIDTTAHQAALREDGRTIAVLGSSLDCIYPAENVRLAASITERGALISEYPLGTKPTPTNFPWRNRIISGLSRGTVIIEAAEDSGSLITAEYTVKQGRLLFALPGNIGSPNSRGPNSLIKEGALLVERAEDILKALKFTAAREKKTDPEPAPRIPLSREEETVFRCITNEPKHIDLIMTEAGATPGKISGTLITLELKGLARQLPGKLFVREE